MRAWIGGLALIAVPAVAAQTAPLDSSRYDRVDASSGLQMLEVLESDEAQAMPDLADKLMRGLGRPWAELRETLPPSDSSAVASDLGDVWWSVPGFPVDGFRAFIQRGLVESVTLDFSSDGPDLAAFARHLYDRHGSPRADGFYATDQTDYPFSLAIDAQANRLTARAVPGQLVGRAITLPIQFSTVAAPSDSVYAYVSDPPELIGGLAALQAAVVYPEEADGVEGTVYVQLVVEADGRPSTLTVARTPDARLNAAALAAVTAMRFTLGHQNGQPVRVQSALPVRFDVPEYLPRISDAEPNIIGGMEGLHRRNQYSRYARRIGAQGHIDVSFTVRASGRAEDIEIAPSTRVECDFSPPCERGREALAVEAIRAIQASEFIPVTEDGQVVPTRYTVPVRYALR